MARIDSITIENYRSISDIPVVINFPMNMPVVLIGENNAGKSNIIRAIDLLFGESHPKYKDLEDYDFNQRDRNKVKVIIKAEVSGFYNRLGRNQEFECKGFRFTAEKGKTNDYCALQNNGDYNQYIASEIRNELCAIFVSSEHNLSYQLSYSSKFTLLSKLTKAFHEKLSADNERINKLKELFHNIVSTFYEVEEFKEFRDNMASISGQIISNMTHGLNLDFSAYDPSNYFKTLKIHPTEAGEIRSFEELGTGQQQILALSFAQAYANSFKGDSLILVLDEPEAHLHPLAQKWLAKTIFKMSQDGIQIVITTHSPYFVNLELFEGIYLVKKTTDGTYVCNGNRTQLNNHCIKSGANPNKTKPETIIPFYSGCITDNISKVFFANKVILVEGPTEELSLPIFLDKVGLDTLKEGIDIISVGGKGNLAKWWRFFTFYKIPVFICFDNDSKEDTSGLKRKDALKTIGIEDSEILQVLNSDSWNISAKYCVFGQDFEATMRASFDSYIEEENIKKNQLGESKHIVARAVARTLTFSDKDVGWIKIKELSEKIRNI